VCGRLKREKNPENHSVNEGDRNPGKKRGSEAKHFARTCILKRRRKSLEKLLESDKLGGKTSQNRRGTKQAEEAPGVILHGLGKSSESPKEESRTLVRKCCEVKDGTTAFAWRG